jgi:hypothetical protein
MEIPVVRWAAEIESSLATIVQKIEVPEPEFSLSIGWSASYDALFEGHFKRRTGLDALLTNAVRHGRVILHAEGGSGKSVVVLRLFREAARTGLIPVLVDIRKWRPPLFEEWRTWSGNEVMRMAMLLRELATPVIDEAVLASVPSRRRRVVLVDGLNEVPSDIANGILSTLEAFARRNPSAGVLVTDRMVRRALPGESWGLASIEPLTEDEIRRVLGRPLAGIGTATLLSTAFFLDLAAKQGLDSTSSSRAFGEYFRRHAGLEREGLLVAGRAAFETYATRRSRTFEREEFEAMSGRGVFEALLGAGVVIEEGHLAYFRHHLFHDYLASVFLAEDETRWVGASFDTITFRASSFDGLAMALEQLEDAKLADLMLRRMYDWNFYASAYALAKGRVLGSVRVTQEMEVALLAMLAERRWDPIFPTVQRVTDALRLFPSTLAQRLLEADGHAAIVGIISETGHGSARFERWRALFSIPRGAAVDDGIVRSIEERDSLLGWTAANVLKRVRLSALQEQHLRDVLLKSQDETLRWRASHALGAHPSAATVDALFGALRDAYHWVRYGAIRSLIEMAAMNQVLRGVIFERLRTIVGELSEDRETLQEFERALLLRDPPPGWAEVVGEVIEELWASADSIALQDHWRKVAYDVQRAGTRGHAVR